MNTALVVDPDLLLRDLIASRLKEMLGSSRIHQAATINDGVALIKKHRVDIMLIDPSTSRIGSTTSLSYERLLIRTIVMSHHCDAITLLWMRELAAVGFISKRTDAPSVLDEAIQAVLSGKAYFSNDYVSGTINMLTGGHNKMKALTNTELAVLQLIASGHDDGEIGTVLRISPLTAKKHRTNIQHKLGMHSTPKLMAYVAQRVGYECPGRTHA